MNMVQPIQFNGSRLRPKNKVDLCMPLKMTRRRFARLSAAAAASLWVHPVFGQTPEAAEWVNPLIGASTSQALGEGKTFPGPTTPFGLVQLSPDTITGGGQCSGLLLRAHDYRGLQPHPHERSWVVWRHGESDDYANDRPSPIRRWPSPISG